MKKTIRNMAGLLIAGMALVVLVAACEGFGSLSGDMDKIWQEVKESRSYTVSFNSQGGSYVAPQTIPYGGKASRPDNPKYEGSSFKEWTKDGAVWDFDSNVVTKDITLTAQWDVLGAGQCNITFTTYTNGIGDQIIDAGGKIVQPEGLVRSGFYLTGWYRDSGFAEEHRWDFKNSPDESFTLFARWLPLDSGQYTVRFIADSGVPVPYDEAVSRYGLVSPPPAITKSVDGISYTFGGWYKDDRTTPWVFETDTITSSTFIYARWNPEGQYTVNFWAGAPDEFGNGSPLWYMKDYERESKITGAEIPITRTGYTARWYITPPDYNNEWNFTVDDVTANQVLMAKWTPISYTVKFNPNNGSGTLADQVFVYDTPQNLRANASPGITRTGYIFAGWNTQADGQGRSYANGENINNTNNISAEPGDVQLYAQWGANEYKVEFNANGGSGAMADQAFKYNEEKPLTANSFTRRSYVFTGWNTDANGGGTSYVDKKEVIGLSPSGTYMLYAQWALVTDVPNGTIASQMKWLRDNAISGKEYTATINSGNQNLAPQSLDSSSDFANETNITIKLKGADATSQLTLSSPGSMFTVDNSITLILDNNITLQGRDNNAAVVTVNTNGALIMNTGSKITRNSTVSNFGGGVYVNGSGSIFEMRGGTISGIKAINNTSGAAVLIYGGGKFDMSGGTIGGTTAADANSANNGGAVWAYGGNFTMSGTALITGNTASSSAAGVYVTNQASFTMAGGTISGNTASGTGDTDGGGAVYVSGSTFTMTDGTIGDPNLGDAVDESNKALRGGGVYVTDSNGTFNMSGGTIVGNKTTGLVDGVQESSIGGGVFVGSGASFTMSGNAAISGNTANSGGGGVFVKDSGSGFTMGGNAVVSDNNTMYGGGVYVRDSGASFTMNNGKISGNTVSRGGGGVIMSNGTFALKGGTISGNTVSGTGEYDGGGGVYISGGIFTMTDGTIGDPNLGDTVDESNKAYRGGGVCVANSYNHTMSGGKITGNKTTGMGSANQDSRGGGLWLGRGVNFTMNGTAAITYNTSDNGGGGVFVTGSGNSFTMSGSADISHNTVGYDSASAWNHGGGVFVLGASFTMNGGTISYNTANNPSSYGGGGVYAASAAVFTMTAGEISNNTAEHDGGGVFSYNYDTKIYINGGEIKNNNAGRYGGGVAATATDTFTISSGAVISGNTAVSGGGVSVVTTRGSMTGGTISGNTASNGSGGGVFIGNAYSTFAISGGEISGNTAAVSGGGVYVESGTFTKTNTGGTIYGYPVTGSDPSSKRNMVFDGTNPLNNMGHTAYVNSDPVKYRDATAGLTQAMNSTLTGINWGWEN